MPTPEDSTPDTDRRISPGLRTLLLAGAALVLLVVIASSIGRGGPLLLRIDAVARAVLVGGWPAWVYLISAIGWGSIFAGLTRGSVVAGAINAACGLAITLSVTQILGAMGWLNLFTAWAWTGIGLVLLGTMMAPKARTSVDLSMSPPAWFGLIGIAVLIVAASSPPGWLWDSEFGGYDALSYHLPLPIEWMDAGRIAPSAHNVYSFLPGYFEGATMHAWLLAGGAATESDGFVGVFRGSGELVMAPQLLAVGMTALGAWWTAALAGVLFDRIGANEQARRLGPPAAGAVVLLTPWTQVVGSLAYNEPGVIALGAAALAAAACPVIAPARRGALVGILVGAACGCKPTAILFVAPAAAVMMLAWTPARHWWRALCSAAIIGSVLLLPWLVRNAAAGGNPVFPQLVSLFGSAHWTDEQVVRYTSGHRFDGSFIDGLRLLVWLDPDATPTAPAVVRWRGLANPQWGLTAIAGIIGIGALLIRVRSRRVGTALGLSVLLAVIAWLTATHLQSRFLLPLIPVFATGAAGLIAVLPGAARNGAVIALLLGASAWSGWNFAEQAGGNPNGRLDFGPGLYTGQLALEGAGDASWWAGTNETVPVGERVLLLGDATPFYLRGPVVYATTWDHHALSQAARASPSGTLGWIEYLREADVGWVLVSPSELARLRQSGWLDPELTVERINTLVRELGAPERTWSDGRALYRVPQQRTAPQTGSS